MGPANLKKHHEEENNGFPNYSVIYIESKRLLSQKGSPVILVAMLVCI